jgi:hypothetical protein
MNPELKSKIERFSALQKEHGPVTGAQLGYRDYTAEVAWMFIEHAIESNRHHGSFGKSLAQVVRERLRHDAADILELMELTYQWTTNPIEAAHQDLRELISQKQREDAESRQAEEEARFQEELQRRAAGLIEEMRRDRSEAPAAVE